MYYSLLRKTTMKITEKNSMNHNTFFMKLECAMGIPELKAVSKVYLYDEEGFRRPYTPLYVHKDTMAFAIKVYPNGPMTNYLSSLGVNDTLVVSELLPVRDCKTNEFKSVLLIAGGTGITPIFQLLWESIYSGRNVTDFTLLFLNKTAEDAFLVSELETLRKKSDGKLQIIYVFSEGTAEPDSLHISGRLTKDLLLRITKSKIHDYVYICGPDSLYESFSGKKASRKQEDELSGILKEVGYDKSQVFKL